METLVSNRRFAYFAAVGKVGRRRGGETTLTFVATAAEKLVLRTFGFSPSLRSIRPAHHGSAFGIG